jgi:two-component system, NtrC family, response regulator HydG
MRDNVRVLVVDDEEGMRMTLAANLELEGYQVIEAKDGYEAVDLIRREPFAVVVTDIRMPGMSGLDTYREIKKIRPDTTVVMMTAFALERLVDEGLQEGVFTVLSKPFSMEHVIAVVERAARKRVVLVVDDLPEMAESLLASLEACGLRAAAVTDGASAVRLVGEGVMDVCVLDIVMPKMSGVDTLKELRGLDPNVTVIAMTGYSVPDLVHQMIRLGAASCLQKPFLIEDLVRTIARARGKPAKA